MQVADNPWHFQLREAYRRLLLDLQARHATEVHLLRNKMTQEVHMVQADLARGTTEVRASAHVHVCQIQLLCRRCSHQLWDSRRAFKNDCISILM